MANPTTNYGFVLPTSSDLVTDLPADFDVALQGVDTRLKALQPGTTLGDIAYSSATANTNTRLPIGTSGQVLAVSGGGVPAWTTTADVTPLTTKGDLFTYTTADARLGVGTDGQTLVADSSTATGLKWATAASGSTFAGCRLYNSVAVNIATSTQTEYAFDSELYDTDGYHSTSTNTARITVPAGKAGYYLVHAAVEWAANSSGVREIYIRKNGGLTDGNNDYLSVVPTGVFEMMVTNLIYLGVGDYVSLYVYQTSGGNLIADVTRNYQNFSAMYLGA